MKVVAHVGVKDEVDLIGSCIRHLESIGVDQIVVCDLGSSDGTLDVLESLSGDGLQMLRAVDLNLEDIEAFKLRNVEMVKRTGADWVMFLDADERWLPATGRIKDCLFLDAQDLLSVRRFNVVLSEGGLGSAVIPAVDEYQSLLLHVRPIEGFRAHFEKGTAPPWSRFVPVPKIMARPSRIASIGTGGHSAKPCDGVDLKEAVPTDLLIAHFPFTTEQRFSRKIRNLARILKAHDGYFGSGMAWHWRKWSELRSESQIAAEFARQVVTWEDIRILRSSGAVRSAAEMLHA